jgi:hypothetical protein
VNPLGEVTATLDAQGIRYALIGAAAMSVHGVTRSTLDVDLLAAEQRCLTPSIWDRLAQSDIEVDVRRGDRDDPLAGVVHFSQPDTRPIDLVVGRFRWQQRAIARAWPTQISEQKLPVVLRSDLVLLKLYAGGPQDMWDIHQLLVCDDRETLETMMLEIERDLPDLPDTSADRWRQLRTEMDRR